jgi:hypothetical protein
MTWGSNPSGGQDFLDPTRPAHPASCTMGTGSISQGYSGWCVTLNLLVSKSSNRTATPPLSLFACSAQNKTEQPFTYPPRINIWECSFSCYLMCHTLQLLDTCVCFLCCTMSGEMSPGVSVITSKSPLTGATNSNFSGKKQHRETGLYAIANNVSSVA